MPEELYVVNTKMRPFFLDEFIQSEHREYALRGHSEFIEKVRKQHRTFGLPYLALFQDGHLQVPTSFPLTLSGGLMGSVADGIVQGGKGHGQDCSLDEFIDRYHGGEGTILIGQKIPITAVVEFATTELYPEAITRLKQKYEIKRMFVE